MSLITEINRINTNKEKAKTVAVKIDNKLVELGGEQATDLNDVPNKMQQMVETQYKKIAIINPEWSRRFTDINNMTQTINFNISFKFSEIFFEFRTYEKGAFVSSLSKKNDIFLFKIGEVCSFEEIKITDKSLQFRPVISSYNNSYDSLYLDRIIAIGE